MRFYFLLLPILAWGLLLVDSFVSTECYAGNMRWGITTHQSEEDKADKQQTMGQKETLEEINKKSTSKPELPVAPNEKSSNQKDDIGVSASDAKESKNPKTGKPDAYPDRPWIIKEEHMKQGIAPGEKSRAVKWENEAQQRRCEAKLKQIKEDFLRARYYSTKGDFCRTASHAKSFLGIVEDCKHECPEKYLENHGYTNRIIRNLSWLEELGSRQCLGGERTIKTEGKK